MDVNYKEVPYLVTEIQKVLYEGLYFIKQYEKLRPREGEVKVIYPYHPNEKVGFEINAPHLIPNALSEMWLAFTFEEAYEACIADLKKWIQIEKEAPKLKFELDLY